MFKASHIDQLGTSLHVPSLPQRIVSLVPSQTELLAYLGLESRVVGITKFCAHPPSWRTTKTIIGGTKKFNLEVIHSLRPDLIIGDKEENYREGIEALQEFYPVWMSDIVSVEDACNMMAGIGTLTGTEEMAQNLISKLQEQFALMKKLSGKRVVYLIWKDPWMAAGENTFINSMLTLAGFENCVRSTRYPTLSADEITELQPEVVLLSSEPYPFREKHLLEISVMLPSSRIVLVDGEMFSWYGSRLLYFSDYLEKIRKWL